MTASPTLKLRFRDSWRIRIGLLMLVFGSGPLIAVTLFAKMGIPAVLTRRQVIDLIACIRLRR